MKNDKPQHTPAPWEVYTTTEHNGYMIRAKSNGMNKGAVEANARLIAAAPELLEAAIAALTALEIQGGFLEVRNGLAEAIKKAGA